MNNRGLGGYAVKYVPMPLFITACIVILILSPGIATSAGQAKLRLSVGGHRVNAEVAATKEARERGLMNRQSLPTDQGMLFVFPESRAWCMWMLDTDIPLSAAFIEEEGTIQIIAEMVPHTTAHHCASAPVRFVLEMNGGWFIEKGVRKGHIVKGLRQAPPGR